MTSDVKVARRTHVHVIDRSEIKRINIFYLRARLLQNPFKTKELTTGRNKYNLRFIGRGRNNIQYTVRR